MNPSPIDLITLSAARSWIFGQNPLATSDNQTLQILITALSLDFLNRTGTGPQNAGVPTASPFNQAVQFVESYTGNGNDLIRLRNSPILSVSSVSIFGQSAPASSGANSVGWFIESSGKFLGLRSSTGPARFGPYGWGGWAGSAGRGRGGWPESTDCIQVTYSAGYPAIQVTNELQTVPATPGAWAASTFYANGAIIFDGTNIQQVEVIQGRAPSAKSGTATPSWAAKAGDITADGSALIWTNLGPPFAVVVNNLPWIADVGVSYFSSGDPLTQVLTNPAQGQYYLQGQGGYLFNSADAGQQMQISYSYAGTPMDIQEAMLRWVNLIYMRRGWEGIRSLMNKDAGSTIYTSFEIDPSVQNIIDSYKRRA